MIGQLPWGQTLRNIGLYLFNSGKSEVQIQRLFKVF